MSSHRTTESNTLIGYITLVTLYKQNKDRWAVKTPFTILWSDLLNATLLILMKRPRIILCLIIIKNYRNHDISSKYYDECNFLVHFAWLVLRLTFSTGKNIRFFSRRCRFFVCTEYFCKHMMCIGIKIFIFEEEFIPYLNEPLWT